MELGAIEHCINIVLGDEWCPVAGFVSISSGVVGAMSGDQAAW